MPNAIKETRPGALALQVTKPARAAGLVEEDADGDATYRADVRVYAFDGLLLVVDRDRVEDAHAAELVATTARDTKSAFDAEKATLSDAGGGYRVQLPTAGDAGIELDDTPGVYPVRRGSVLVIATGRQQRLARDLVSIRESQLAQSRS